MQQDTRKKNGHGSPEAQKKTVLVVEDDEDFLPLVNMMLQSEGLNIVVAASGRRGLEAVRAHRPDVVILDLMLPDMHGWDVLKQIRSEETSKHIPIIILSVIGSRQDRLFGKQVAKVHDYLLKPCLPSQLRQSVASALAA